jgi:hypothetical protein
MLSAAGCGFLLWILAKKNHPDLSLEKCVSLVNEVTPEIVMTELAESSGMSKLSGN